jgi:hypothetical protein
MRILASVLAVPLVVLAWQWWHDTSTERELAPVASAIAGRDVEIDCQTFWGELIDPLPRHGEVLFERNGIPEPRIFLTHDTCGRLASFSGRRHHPELDCLLSARWGERALPPFDDPCYAQAAPTIYAVLTLAHEAYHTAGVMNEAVTNCFATQSVAYAAAELGADEVEARRLASAMAALLPFQGDRYRTSECVRGSRLDLWPETVAFPSEAPLVAPRGRGGMRGIAAGAA